MKKKLLAQAKETLEKAEDRATVYSRIAHALARGYTDLYYVNMETDELIEFHTDDERGVLSEARRGTDFFEGCARDARLYVHPEDQAAFVRAMNHDFLTEALRRSNVFEMTYRRILDGRTFYVQMRVSRMEDDPRIIVLAVSDIDELMQQRQEEARLQEERLIYARLHALTGNFICVYVVDPATDDYREFSATDDYVQSFAQAKDGKDFFGTVRKAAQDFNHPEDLERFLSAFTKENILGEIDRSGIFTLDYRLVMEGTPVYVQMKAAMVEEKEGPRLVVGLNNIDAEVRAKLAQKADLEKRVTYTRIAERLASRYDLIYYINCETLRYAEFSSERRFGELTVQHEGEDFFKASEKQIDALIHPEDRERIRLFLDRDQLISQLETQPLLAEDYRMLLSGGKMQYTRMTVTYSSDHSHFIICVENRDQRVRRQQEHLAALRLANEIARRDELTHTKNKTAYREVEKDLQKQLEEGAEPFGIVVCDINNLKVINDTEGHKAGDDYIKASCRLICRVFKHSPVFRIGGDEFVVLLYGQELEKREKLLSSLTRYAEENNRIGEGPVVAAGVSVCQPEDRTVQDVFDRADSLMYENKLRLKEQKLLQESLFSKQKAVVRVITEERRLMLEALYRSFEVVSEGSYVFLCDMKYDYSRWSKNAVDTFGLPSEYMYGAGDIWAEHIHPEDREAYHKGIADIFSGNAGGHDMQYRARRPSGEYDVCTCRGIVIRDAAGESDYFVGAIRNHGIQGHIDTLTGLRNQYGFFEDLNGYIKRNVGVRVLLVGISKFSEINEMHGYHFGNRVLQCYGRRVYEWVGNAGRVYRIDGTKFAVINNTLSVPELKEHYDRFRTLLHEDFQVDGRKVLLDLHCGALQVDSFDVDSQTVYACLNYADEESKLLRKGELVEFRNELNGENHQRLELLHAIRGSITNGYQGFYLLYQPVVDAKTERMIGAEALLRWKDERFGIVPPDQFIPVLETDPLFSELGEWIIRQAVLAAKQILPSNPDFVVNVNLSYSQLEKPGFADMVLHLLRELDYPPEHLCLEITERCRLLDLQLLKNTVVNLRSIGVLIALDDFGTGFSAIGLLKEIPLDTIKIDRSFVTGIEERENDRQLIRLIVDLAAVFGAKVCVEGIETAGMRDILRHYRVESFQGYYYAKPLPLDRLTDGSHKFPA